MRTLALSLFLLSAQAQEWFVAGAGRDANDGQSEATAFRTLDRAAAKVQPGDTVWVLDGTYTNAHASGSVVNLVRSGTAEAWITWKAKDGHKPELVFTGWNGMAVDASYQIIDGLTVTGNNDRVTFAEAEADYEKRQPDPRFNGNGINSDCRKGKPAVHHVVVRHCTVRKCAGAGITGIGVDHWTLEDNTIYENAWYMRYAGSGISFLRPRDTDRAPGYHLIVRRNRVWNNRCLVKWKQTGKYSDGNGIIIDTTKAKPGDQDGAWPSFAGRILVCNNVSWNNGGSGIHGYFSEHIDIVNNTAWHNGQKVGYEEIFANNCNDVRIIDNIMVTRDGGAVTSNHKNTEVRYDGNLYWNGKAAVTGPHDVIADPLFVHAATDPDVADFRLKPGSPALDSAIGLEGASPVDDLLGAPRPQGRQRDKGAYEMRVGP